jgi:hypothetical protein
LSLHDTWQSGDNWQLIAPDTTQGRGGTTYGEKGSQWWVNPYNPNTPGNGVYSVSNGILQLGLLPTPSAEQAYINQQAGTDLPYVGALLNTSQTDYQQYGYYDIAAAIDRVPGFDFHADTENVQLTGQWPPEVDLDIYTDASDVQHVKFSVATDAGRLTYTSSASGFDATSYHDYSWNWQSDYITFYIDGQQVWQTPNPGGVYTTEKQFLYIGTYANYPDGVDPNTSSLPAYADLDYVRVYQNKPGSPTPSPTPTPSSNEITTTSSGTLTDAAGNQWTLPSAGVVDENGTPVPGGDGTSAFAIVGNSLYGQDASTKSWYTYSTATQSWTASAAPVLTSTGTPTPPPTPAPTPTATASANNTVVMLGSTAAITDAGNNKWTITAGGQVAVNGQTDTTTGRVTELAYVNGEVWQENISALWWCKTGPTASWAPAAGTATSPLAASASLMMFIGGSGHTVGNTGGNDKITDTGGGNTYVLPAVGKGYDTFTSNILTVGDALDLKTSLAATNWNGSASTLANYLAVTDSTTAATLSISATSGGSATAIATIDGATTATLSSLLAHSTT